MCYQTDVLSTIHPDNGHRIRLNPADGGEVVLSKNVIKIYNSQMIF